MGLMFLFVLGAIVGWVAAIVLKAENEEGLLRNSVAGIAGALLAGLLVSPLSGSGSLLAGTYEVTALLLSLVGAVVAIVGANLFKRWQVR